MASLSLLSRRLVAARSSASALWRTVINRNYSSAAKDHNLGREIEPTNFQKRILVWTKVYKRVEDIPSRIPSKQMTVAMDWFRGRTMVVMMGLGFFGFYLMIRSGRKLRDAGDSLTHRGNQQVLEWQEQERLRRQREEHDQQEK